MQKDKRSCGSSCFNDGIFSMKKENLDFEYLDTSSPITKYLEPASLSAP